jgi:hypothetical protein
MVQAQTTVQTTLIVTSLSSSGLPTFSPLLSTDPPSKLPQVPTSSIHQVSVGPSRTAALWTHLFQLKLSTDFFPASQAINPYQSCMSSFVMNLIVDLNEGRPVGIMPRPQAVPRNGETTPMEDAKKPAVPLPNTKTTETDTAMTKPVDADDDFARLQNKDRADALKLLVPNPVLPRSMAKDEKAAAKRADNLEPSFLEVANAAVLARNDKHNAAGRRSKRKADDLETATVPAQNDRANNT